MPTILHLIDTTDSGGAQRLLYDWMRQPNKGFAYHVGVLQSPKYYSKDLSEVTNVHHLNRAAFDLRVVYDIRQLIRRVQPDLVHTHLFRSVSLGALVAIQCGIPTIIHQHSGTDVNVYAPYLHSRHLARLYWLFHMQAARRANAIITVTKKDQIYYQDRGITRVYQIPNAIIPELYSPAPITNIYAELPLLIQVGRFSSEKGWDLLLEALALLKDESWRLLGVGDGSTQQEMRALAERLGILERIEWLGVRNDVPELLKTASLMIQSSYHESFGITILEGMATRLPVIATRTAGAQELIQHEYNGLLCERTPQTLAAAIRRLLLDRQLAQSLAEQGYLSMRSDYVISAVFSRIESLYSQII